MFNQNAESFSYTIGSNSTDVKINKSGVTIKNGALTVTNSNGVTTIDASKLMLRILTYGNGSITLASGVQNKEVVINHNLGYSPIFKGQFRFTSSSGTVETYSDSMTLYDWSTGTVRINGRMYVTDTQLIITIWRSATAASSGQQTFYYRYFIEDGVSL